MTGDRAFRPKARLPRGFRDRGSKEVAAERRMLETLARVFDSFGFSPLETPSLEYADALGKFLPDQDRPNEGVFSFADDDGQWLSLRYDLTAPLARHVAEHYQALPKPFRRYQMGTVWRNEKPGPGRFREFVQCDADTVGSASPAADAELLMMLCDALEAVGLGRGDYVVKLNSRRLLDGILETAGVAGDPHTRGAVLRAIDKLDRLGPDGVRALLGKGRKDESGDFTKGADLDADAISKIVSFIVISHFEGDMITSDWASQLEIWNRAVGVNDAGASGIRELKEITDILRAADYGPDRIYLDPGIVRGLDYYTGAVFEAQVTFPVRNEAGETVVVGSIASGGRYDDLVARFTGQRVPATGVSVGVSRLIAALESRGAVTAEEMPLVVVLVLDRSEAASAFAIARELRAAGIRAEAYVGDGRMGAQLKYADRRGAALAVIEGADERAAGTVTVKDLALGAELAKSVESRAQWVGDRPAQESVKRADLVAHVRSALTRHRG